MDKVLLNAHRNMEDITGFWFKAPVIPITVQYADEQDKLNSEAESQEFNDQFESDDERGSDD